MQYQLRDYQSAAISTGIDFITSYDRSRPMLVLPTGAGKSIIIAMITKSLGHKVLVLQPSIELLTQNYQKYENVIKDHDELESASIFSAGVGVKEIGRITFATIGSIYKIPELFADVDIIIIDECHFVPPDRHSMYMKFISALNARVLGLTATPFRLKTYNDPFTGGKFSKINLLNRERPSFFNKFIHITQISELYEKGFLCPINYIEMQFDGSFLKVNSTGAEYTEKSLKETVERNDILKKIPNVLDQAFKKGRRACLVFVSSIEEARQLAEITPFSNYLYADMNKADRKQIIKEFKSGGIKTIFNVGILTTGFDYPELDTIILARPTMSLALYIQMIGRGIRIAPNKERLSVLDMCGNVKKFGKIENIVIEEDPHLGWVLRNGDKILSGRRLDELI